MTKNVTDRLMHSAGSVGFAVFALALAAPILFVAFSWIGESGSGFLTYLFQRGLLQEYAKSSIMIAGATVLLSCLLAVPAAWVVTMYDFAGRKWLSWALILPLAIPPYIAAIVYGDVLEGAGVVQHFIRESLHLRYGDYMFLEIRSQGGAVFVLTFTLYPYIYLLTRAAFLMQSAHMLETALLLGCSQKQLFGRVALPIARPAIATGAALVLMESLADFGVASLFGVPVLTTGIYRAWQSMYDITSAAHLALCLLVLVLVVLGFEKWQRGQAQYHNQTALYHPLMRWKAGKRQSLMCWLITGIPVFLGFIVPLLVLGSWSAETLHLLQDERTVSALLDSVVIASFTAMIALLVGLLTAYRLRLPAPYYLRASIGLLTSGYAISGSVIAVGVLISMLWIQEHLLQGQLWLSGTMLGVLWGCSLRFLTVSFNTMQSGLERISPSLDEAAMMLGCSSWQRLKRVHLPLLNGAMLAALMLVFVDTVKELPATLLLRPFNVNTLAIRAYELAKDDMVTHAAPVALLLILVSLLPVLYLNRQFSKSSTMKK